ncbi:MAG: tetratricopeptide repeat protein [Chloroflexi bacterium]|nr:tetratricopeptide repeat protein [Chloroflexota bacterium]
MEAIRFDEQALRENADKDLHSKAIALNGLGIAYRNIGNYDKAIEYYEQALVLARQEKDTASEGRVLGNLGNCYFYVGDYARAIDYNRQGLDLALRLRQKRAEGIRLGNLALAYSAIGNYKEALLHAERALQICVEVDDKRNESINRGYVAICHHNLGSYDEAIRNHNLSLAIAREYGMRSIEAYRVDAIGETYMTIGEYDRAEQQYAEALRITTEINTLPQQNFIRMKLGQLHLMQDRFTDGVSLLEAVVANPTPLVEDRARMLLGVGYLKLGRREAAILQFKAAREAAERILAKSELAYRASYSEALAFYGMLIASDASDAPPPDTILGIGASFSKAVRGCRDVGALTELTIPYSMLKLLDEQAIFRTLDIIIEGTENGSSNPAT